MRDLKLDGSHDLLIDDHDLVIESEPKAAVSQFVKIRLLMFYGEWYFNSYIGIPYFDFILGHKPNLGFTLPYLQNEIELEREIARVSYIDGEVEQNRNFTVQFTATIKETNETIEDEIEIRV